MSPSRTRCIGMAVHKETIAVASVAQEHGAAGTSLGTIGTRQGAIAPLLRPMPSQATHGRCLSAAGPCGDWRSRSCTTQGAAGWVVAPSRIPTTAGARVNTDRRAAGPRARLARSGDRPAVSVPPGAAAARRDRRRARAEALGDCTAATWRRTAFLLRHARRSTGRATWTQPLCGGARKSSVPLRAAHGRPGIWPRGHRTPRAPSASRTRTPSAGHSVARAPRGRGPAGTPRCAVHRRGHPGGGTWRPDALRYPQSPHEIFGPGPLGLCPGRAPPPRLHPASRPHPCASRPGRRRLGGALSGDSPPASPTQTRKATPSPPGPPREGPGQALYTGPHTHRPRQTRPPSGGGHRPCPGGLAVGHGQTGAGDTVPASPHGGQPYASWSRGPPGIGKSRSPGFGVPLDGVQRPSGPSRAESVAGTRRRPGRGDFTHG